ncbi:MAG: elongation factor G [Planctomycetales bacterium]
MIKAQNGNLRNVALIGHGAVGKTTLADQILFRAGMVQRAGSVDDGTSLLDADDDEKERHFTITSHLAHFEHDGRWINLIDTPGYPDFIGQTIGALRGVETAVITIAADSGIAVNTRKVFAQATRAGIGRMIALTMIDHDNINFTELLEDIQSTFGKQCIPFNVPDHVGPKFSAVVSTLRDDETAKSDVIDVNAVHLTLLDAIVEADEELMERYLNGEKLTPEEIDRGIERAIAAGTLIPIFCLCAKSGVGVPEFMAALSHHALPPKAIERHALDTEGHDIILSPTPEGPLVAQVFKTRIDPFVSKLSYLRIFSGKIVKDQPVHCLRTGKTLKFHQIFHTQGNTTEPVDSAEAGDIVAVAKVDDLHMGDILCTSKDLSMPSFEFPTPMIGLAVEPKSRNDQQKISGALHKIEEEDPTFKVTREAQTHELVIQGMSELHLQIVRHRLQIRDKVDVVTHAPKIPYRETVTGTHEGSYRHKKQSGGAGQFAEVHLKISPLPHGINPVEYFTKERFPSLREYHYDPQLNFAFVDRVSGGTVPNQFIPAVEKGVRDRMEKGVIAGCQVQDCVVELFFGKDHPVDSNENAFRTAGGLCFRNIFREARPTLLEPIVHAEITVPGNKLGEVTSDLNSRRGRMEGMESSSGGTQILQARVPLSEMMTYARTLSSITGGQGSFTMELSHYDQMPQHEQQKVVAAAQHLHEEEE